MALGISICNNFIVWIYVKNEITDYQTWEFLNSIKCKGKMQPGVCKWEIQNTIKCSLYKKYILTCFENGTLLFSTHKCTTCLFEWASLFSFLLSITEIVCQYVNVLHDIFLFLTDIRPQVRAQLTWDSKLRHFDWRLYYKTAGWGERVCVLAQVNLVSSCMNYIQMSHVNYLE